MSAEPESARCAQLALELAQARAELEDFTYSVSHDLRASLRHVSAYVQIIQEDLAEQPGADISGHLATVTQAARQMSRQMDGLMALSRLGRAPLHCAPLALGELAQQAMSAALAAQPRPGVVWTLAPALPAVLGDPALLHELLTHLLSNALKFSHGRAPAEVSLSGAPADPGWCEFVVMDNGAGFNPQYQDKLFRAFQRLHRPRDFEGLGMGLALSRKIIERHGGRIWAEGAVDGGCRIHFRLPAAA